jgi:hypothetical protein
MGKNTNKLALPDTSLNMAGLSRSFYCKIAHHLALIFIFITHIKYYKIGFQLFIIYTKIFFTA